MLRYLFVLLLISFGYNETVLSDQLSKSAATDNETARPVRLFLSGDVMLGRAIDQILPDSNNPVLYERYIRDARDYVRLAEEANGPINQPVDCPYIWGDALDILDRHMPDARIVNLETSITQSDDAWRNKTIHYRLHPKNTGCLQTAGIDVACVANNHVLDWGYHGLGETLRSLEQSGIQAAGAGHNRKSAESPAIININGKHRIVITAWAMADSGVPPEWSATTERPGINRLDRLDDEAIQRIANIIHQHKQPGDIAVLSIHWGGNWGYYIPHEQIRFAHRLIDDAGIDVVHGHSSHHPKAIEVYKNKLIIYGSGDLLNDYEGIGGHEGYRASLSLMYFADIDPASGSLVNLSMTPVEVRNLSIRQASQDDAGWLATMLNSEGRQFSTGVKLSGDAQLELEWHR